MIRAKDLIPQIYSESFDMSIFLGLIDLIYNARDAKIEILKNSHFPASCIESKLKNLAKIFNIDTSNRDIIANYKLLVKQKGTLSTIQSLALLCGAIPIPKSGTDSTWIYKIYPPEGVYTYKILINADISSMNLELFYSLLENLAPADTIISVTPIKYTEP